MSFTLQAGVILDSPPIKVDRGAEGGPARAVARAIDGTVFEQEMALTQEKSRLVLFLSNISDAQRASLETALNTQGPRTVYTGAESVSCIPAPRSEHQWKEIVCPDGFEDVDVNDNPLPAWMTRWSARIVYYRQS
jgi:hypothetical protein